MYNLKHIIEAILFASGQPVTISRLRNILDVGKKEIKEGLEELQKEYSNNRGFIIEEIAGGYQMLSNPQYSKWIKRLEKKSAQRKLTTAGLETLAIIAYKQPILRADIEAIRGVDSSDIIRKLVELGLARIVGRANTLGRPFLYGTTKKFLGHFGLKDLSELPSVTELGLAQK